jgi:hypothetical protein
MFNGASDRHNNDHNSWDKDNKNTKGRQRAKALFNEREKVEQEITFLIDASQILTVRCINFDIQGYQDRIAICSFILQQRPTYEDQNLFEQDLDDELSRWAEALN